MNSSLHSKTDPMAFNEAKDLRDVAVEGVGTCPSLCREDITGDKIIWDMAPGEIGGV